MKKLFIALLIGFGVYGYLEDNPGFIPASLEEVSAGGRSLAAAYEKHQSGVQVEGSGRVIRVLPDDNIGSRHQKFIIRLSSGQTLMIAHNIDLAPRINSVKAGDMVDYSGEYEWNDRGGVVHWTHNDPSGRHVGGWLKHKGRIYR